MAWFYNNYSGSLIEESAPAPEFFVLEGLLHAGNGWHEYGSQADVDAAVAANHWPAPTTSTSKQVSNAAGSATSAATGGLTGFLGDLGSRNLWLRVAKVIAGLGLVLIGVIQLTHAQNIAKTAVKGAVLE